MKKLNKKGFTLVELLAVVVILAILIAVVAGTAIPAMNSAKVKALGTYADRLSAKAKEKCLVEKIGEVSTTCSYPTIADIMGEDNAQYSVEASIVVTIDSTGKASVTQGTIKDKSNNSKSLVTTTTTTTTTTTAAGA